MKKRQRQDEVIKELWAVKDATAEQYSSVGDYLAHLRQSTLSKKNGSATRAVSRASVKARSVVSRRKAIG